MAIDFGALANSLGNAVESIGTASAKATAKANAISAQAQSAQGAFNQESANQANMINENTMLRQFGFNSAQAEQANAFTQGSWEQAAEFNERMWQNQADFNAEQAQIQRDWQERMANTQYQRAMNDMQKAGLNPILAANGISGGIPSGAVASVGGAQMSSAQGAMASGGLLGANTASEGNYNGIPEQMGTTLALLGAIFGGLSSAAKASGALGDTGGEIMSTIADQVDNIGKGAVGWGEEAGKWVKDQLKNAGKWIKNKFTGETEHVTNSYTYNNLKQNEKRLNNDYRFKHQVNG